MGSYTFDGSISVHPALNFAQFKQVQEAARQAILERHGGKAPRWIRMENEGFDPEAHMPLRAVVEETSIDTDEGTMLRKSVSGFVPTNITDGSLDYSLADQMNRLIKLFSEHEFSGIVSAVEVEEYYSAVRIVVEPGQSVKDVHGRMYIHFEDGGQVELSSLI